LLAAPTCANSTNMSVTGIQPPEIISISLL
jgi:hypothetical protein